MPFEKNENICKSCFDSFSKIKGLFCKRCGAPLKDGGAHCYDCKKDGKSVYFDVLRAPYMYETAIKKLIKKFKYSGRSFLAEELSVPMTDLIRKEAWDNQIDAVIAVPLHFFKKFKRGYNQSYLLARHIGLALQKETYENVLIRKKLTKPQFGLKKKQREKNLENTFVINPKLIERVKGKNVLLVDDVATTCTTANLCAKALKKAKTKKIFVIALARAKI